MLNWKSPNAVISYALIALAAWVFLYVIHSGLGGDNAVFAVLGYVAGALNVVCLFWLRKSPPKP